MAVRTYDPKNIAVILGGNIMRGFGDGTFVKVSRNEQAYTLKVGVDGEGTRSKSNNKSGKIEITLDQGSSSNDVLSTLASADELSNQGVVPAMIRDNSGRTICSAASAWISKLPDSEFAKEVSMRTWVIETDALEMFVGGN